MDIPTPPLSFPPVRLSRTPNAEQQQRQKQAHAQGQQAHSPESSISISPTNLSFTRSTVPFFL